MLRSDVHPGAGWLAVAGLVLAWDAFNARSLTSYARTHKRVTVATSAVVVGHLVGVLPVVADPFTYLGYAVRRRQAEQ